MTPRSSWPLYEVFVRGKRGLNHVHVGSLHAPDAEMALRNARDLYTRRNEGVWIWVVPAAAITASSPDEKDSFFAPERRQGLPAPDVLRDPRGRAAPMSFDNAYDAHHVGRRRPALGVRHRLRRPAVRCGPCGARRRVHSGLVGVLPDAGRRRVDPVAAADRVVLARAGAGGGRRAGEHRAGPARPGAAAAVPGRRGGRRGPRRGHAGLPARRARVPQRAAGGDRLRPGPRRRLRDDDRAAAGVLDVAAGGVPAAGVVGGPGAGRDRGKGREGAGLPPRPRGAVDAAAGRRHGVLAEPG